MFGLPQTWIFLILLDFTLAFFMDLGTREEWIVPSLPVRMACIRTWTIGTSVKNLSINDLYHQWLDKYKKSKLQYMNS